MEDGEKRAMIANITCTRCKHFAWHGPDMKPQPDGNGKPHHPACPSLTETPILGGGGTAKR